MRVYENTENAIINSILSGQEFSKSREKVKMKLSEIKNKISKNERLEISQKNILTLVNLQFSIFLSDFQNLDFGVRLKVFLIFFARYVHKKEIYMRFQDFDIQVDLLKHKKTMEYLNS